MKLVVLLTRAALGAVSAGATPKPTLTYNFWFWSQTETVMKYSTWGL